MGFAVQICFIFLLLASPRISDARNLGNNKVNDGDVNAAKEKVTQISESTSSEVMADRVPNEAEPIEVIVDAAPNEAEPIEATANEVRVDTAPNEAEPSEAIENEVRVDLEPNEATANEGRVDTAPNEAVNTFVVSGRDLQIGGNHQQNLDRTTGVLNVEDGTFLILTCTLPIGSANRRTYWYENREDLEAHQSTEFSKTVARLSLTAKPSDNGRELICAMDGSDRMKTVKLHVKPARDVSRMKISTNQPEYLVAPGVLSVEQGTKLELRCHSHGTHHVFSWWDGKQELSSSQYSNNNDGQGVVLTIDSVSSLEDHKRRLTCRADGSSAHQTITLHVKESPSTPPSTTITTTTTENTEDPITRLVLIIALAVCCIILVAVASATVIVFLCLNGTKNSQPEKNSPVEPKRPKIRTAELPQFLRNQLLPSKEISPYGPLRMHTDVPKIHKSLIYNNESHGNLD